MLPQQDQESGHAPLRALTSLRLSVKKEGRTGIKVQREHVMLKIKGEDFLHIGEAVDENVSGAVDPFDRGALGDWLKNRFDEFDVIIFHKLDRASRETLHILLLLEWAEERGKRIIILENPSYDTATAGDGERISLIVNAEVGRAERRRIMGRVVAAVEMNRQLGKYPGGPLPIWLTVVPHPSGEGWAYTLRPQTDMAVKVMLEIVRRVIRGDAYTAIARDFNSRNVPLPTDLRVRTNPRQEEKPRRKLKGGWAAGTVIALVDNRLLIGEKEVIKIGGKEVIKYKGTTRKIEHRFIIRDPSGVPIQFCDALISVEEYEQIQMRLSGAPRSAWGRGDLHDIVYCASCGGKRYLNRTTRALSNGGTRNHEYYCCRNSKETVKEKSKRKCVDRQVLAAAVRERIDTDIRAELGHRSVYDRVDPITTDYAGKIAYLRNELLAISELYIGTKSQTGKAAYKARTDRLDEEIARLEEEEANAPTTEYVSTGRIFEELWDSAHWCERGDLLRRIGITFSVSYLGESNALSCQMNTPDDIDQRLRVVTSGGTPAAASYALYDTDAWDHEPATTPPVKD